MKTTQYYEHVSKRKHPEVSLAECRHILDHPIERETQSDGRIRVWGRHPRSGRFVRVVLEPDGETLHTAFVDRGYERRRQQDPGLP